MKKFIIPVTAYTFLLTAFSSVSMLAAKSAFRLCVESVIPALFPFFVCSNLLVNMGSANMLSKVFGPLTERVFNLNGACSLAIIMGYISGYPVGAKTAADLYSTGSCSKDEAEKLLAFCNNSGPMFIIGAVGNGMLGNPGNGILIYISHIIASLTVAIILRSQTPSTITSKKMPLKSRFLSFGEILTESISSSVVLILNVCGFVVIFAIMISFIEALGVISALSSFGIDYGICRSLIYSFLESTGGCSFIAATISSPLIKLMLLSAVISWSGLSVHLQVLGIIRKAKLSPKLYFKGKVLSAIISPFITMFLYGFKTGYLKPITLICSVVAVFSVVKILSFIRQIYFRYSAQPPR